MAFALDKWLISILVFSFLILGMVFVIGNINTNYSEQGVFINTSSIGEEFNASSLYTTSQNQKSEILEGDLSAATTESSMFSGAFSAMRFVSDSFSIVGNIIQSVSEEVGIPSWMIQFLMAGITILIVFALIYLIFRIR